MNSFTHRFIKKIYNKILHYYRFFFQHRNYIFVHAGPFSPPNNNLLEFSSFNNSTAIPQTLQQEITKQSGEDSFSADIDEINQNGTMWVAHINKKLACVLFTRRGSYFKNWFVNLNDQDIVIFRLRTHSKFRGKKIAPTLIKYAINNSISLGNKAYIDCRVYNKPSISCIKKAGFTLLKEMKPISKEQALK